ncbi:MAG: thiamine pyrophosphate-dependent enzyme [Planctomycetota bacterium]
MEVPIPPRGAELDDARRVDLYRHMLRLRVLDTRMSSLQRQGRIGFYGTATGQEAAVLGSVAAIEPHDWIFPALREGGAALFRGYPLSQFVRQLMGRDGEASRGRQMPCHFTFRAGGFVSMSSVVGTQVLHAVGVAIAARLRGDPMVALAYLGDGATSSGDFHAGLNFAAVRQAPVVFFCQNNHWAISLPVARQSRSASIAEKAVAYGMPGVRVDGNDLAEVYRVTRQACERARERGGPTLVEAVTYRLHGHSSADDASRYRSDGEVEAWRERDPLALLRTSLEGRGLWDAAREAEASREIRAEIDQAIEEAERSPPPPVASLFEDVYATLPEHLAEARAELERVRARS